MDDAPDIIERHELFLDELARMTLVLARDQQQRALAGDAKQAAEYGRLYNQTARSLRQTLALKARLDREVRALNRERREETERKTTQRTRTASAPATPRWTEAERLDAAWELGGDTVDRRAPADEAPARIHIAPDPAAFAAAPRAGRASANGHDPETPWRSSA